MRGPVLDFHNYLRLGKCDIIFQVMLVRLMHMSLRDLKFLAGIATSYLNDKERSLLMGSPSHVYTASLWLRRCQCVLCVSHCAAPLSKIDDY